MKVKVTKNMSRNFNKVIFKVKKHGPEILIGAGIVGTVTSGVLACKATMKTGNILDEMKSDLESVNKAAEELKEKYSEEDKRKAITIVYAQTGLKFVKLYAPSVILGALSLTSIIASHKILRTRNVALAAAYATVDKGFKEYRNRVIERFGTELDRELKYNVTSKNFDEIVVDEKGKEKTEKHTVDIASPNEYSDYARFFDSGCTGWTKDPEHNLIFLKQQQNFANDKLKAKGYLFLNDVYGMLGIPESKAGQIVGWVYNEEEPIGDNYVDFGLYDTNKEAVRNFVNGYERTILLDFNVDGNILDLM